MNALVLVVIALTFIFTLIVIIRTIHNRKRITCMAGMMIAMAMGMNVGLTIGVIFGILFSGNLFMSSLAGMLIGMGTGFVTGLPVSIMAVLDGLLSGLMGGLMGAMLGEMIAPDYHSTILKIMFFMFISIILLLFKMIHNMINNEDKHYLSHPLTLIGLFGVIFVVFEKLN
ncbi:hypothetical protein [Aquibacillus albus]|uniref:Thiamine transporter ThiT n=1 Tax=Aquibacillus albus TaxID=1168171 RepID=A0ABS2MXF8_9BACI|nr:hypothetical protein [Aquibacillus albus]MBM7570566.1 thiamine transporter ThiT [Aquibacillus albus]